MTDERDAETAADDEDGWRDVLEMGAAGGPKERTAIEERSKTEAAETCSMEAFVDMEGSYMAENGVPMVKRGSMKALYSMIMGR